MLTFEGQQKVTEYICVMNRHKDFPQEEFGMEIAFNVDKLGLSEAFNRAQEFMNSRKQMFKNLDYKLEVRKW